jgi:D-alanyl-D-alanine carboxypeptidase
MKKFLILFLITGFILPATMLAYFPDMSALNTWRARGGFLYEVKRGSSGFEVKTVQTYLASVMPEQNIKPDGIFGPKTESALKLFEKNNSLPETGKVSSQTKTLLTENLKKELCPISSLEDDPFTIFPLSREEGLPVGFVPKDLKFLPSTISTNGIICVSAETYDPLVLMLTDAKNSGVNIIVTSGFRKFEIQEYLVDLYLKIEGPSALRGVAEAGHSEHQLGTTVDFSSSSVGGVLSEKFKDTKEGLWLQSNAHKYGFVMSFPSGKEDVTGYKFEPWHYRYVGTETSQEIKDSSLTPIEYLKEIEKTDSE